MGDVTRIEDARGEEARVGLDELAREGARRMIAAALEAEVDEYVASLVEELGEDGGRLVVRNGRAQGAPGDGRLGDCGAAGAARQRPARR